MVELEFPINQEAGLGLHDVTTMDDRNPDKRLMGFHVEWCKAN
jgi:hypothetical protein